MTAETSTPPSEGIQRSENQPSTVINAVIGGFIGIVFAFVPMSPVLGGGVAGYLQGGDSSDGVVVGAVSGLIMLIPAMLIAGLMMVFFAGMPRIPLLGIASVLFVVILASLYTVALGSLGGVLGTYIKRNA